MSDARETDKAPDAFRTISEVAQELDLPQHVLRFWETRFSQIKPVKRAGGRRFYRPEDVDLLRGIRHLLYTDGYTIKGVQKILNDAGVRHVQDFGAEREAGRELPRELPREVPRDAGRERRQRAEGGEASPARRALEDNSAFGTLLGLIPRRKPRPRPDEAPFLDAAPTLPFGFEPEPAFEPAPSRAPKVRPDTARTRGADRERLEAAPFDDRARDDRAMDDRAIDHRARDDRGIDDRAYDPGSFDDPRRAGDLIPEPRPQAPRRAAPRAARERDPYERPDEGYIDMPAPQSRAGEPPSAPQSALHAAPRIAPDPTFAPDRAEAPRAPQRRPSRGPAARIAAPEVWDEEHPVFPFMEEPAEEPAGKPVGPEPLRAEPLDSRIRRLAEQAPSAERSVPFQSARPLQGEIRDAAPFLSDDEWTQDQPPYRRDAALGDPDFEPAPQAPVAPPAPRLVRAPAAAMGTRERSGPHTRIGPLTGPMEELEPPHGPAPRDLSDAPQPFIDDPFELGAEWAAYQAGHGPMPIEPAPRRIGGRGGVPNEGASLRGVPRAAPTMGEGEMGRDQRRPVVPPVGWDDVDAYDSEMFGARMPPRPLRPGPPEQYLPPHLRSEPRVSGSPPGAAPVLSRDDVHRLQAALYELGECRRLVARASGGREDEQQEP